MGKPFFLPSRHFLITGVLALICILLALGGAEVVNLLRYDRAAIASGEVWRLLTGHLVHLGWSHLWLNLAGLALIWLLVGVAFEARGWMVVFLFCSLSIGAGLYILDPRLQWYVGLSGVLHGLLIAGVVASWNRQQDARWILLIVIAKLAWEQSVGPLPGSEGAAGGPVIVNAHLYGAISGFLAAAAAQALRRITKAAA